MNTNLEIKTSGTRSLRTRALALAVSFILPAAAALAQVAPPTPRSVAPDYKPPQTSAPDYSATGKHTYIAPHAQTWDFYFNLGCWFFGNSTINASHVYWDTERDVNNDLYDVYADGKLKMDFDNAFAFGFGLGYNITEQLSVHALFSYATPDYKATFTGHRLDDGTSVSGTARGEADISTGELSVRYDFLQGKWRPFVQASIGFMYIDTGIVDGYGYWYDWYWGGGAYASTVDHTYFTLGATAGVNYDFTKNFFARFAYTANWANTPREWMLTQRLDLSIGWNY